MEQLYTIRLRCLLLVFALFLTAVCFAQNVGIGTNAPSSKLDVLGTNTVTDGTDGIFGAVRNNSNSTNVMSGLRFQNGTTAGTHKGGIFFQDKASYGRGSLIFATNATGGAGDVTAADARLTIQYNGNIGIGTTAPQSLLHLVGDLRYDDGNQQAGYVMTSDANGVASWQPAAGGGLWTEVTTGSGTPHYYVTNFGNDVNGTTVTNDFAYDGASENAVVLRGGTSGGLHIAGGWHNYLVFDMRNASPNSKLMTFNASYDPFVTTNSWLSLTSMTDASGTKHALMAWNQESGNVGIRTGGAGLGNNPAFGSGVLYISRGTAPTTAATGSAGMFAETVGVTTEMRVIDGAGNITTISPHNFSLIPSGACDDMSWAYYSENTSTGKVINVDMLKTVRLLEELTGEQLVYTADLKDKNADGTFPAEVVSQKDMTPSVTDLLAQMQDQLEAQKVQIEALQQQLIEK